MILGEGVWLKINTHIHKECSIVGVVEIIVADVAQSEVVAKFCIQHLVGKSTTDTYTAIEALEIVIAETAVSRPLSVILNLATYTTGHVSANKGFYRCGGCHLGRVFQHHGNFDVIEVEGEFLTMIFTFSSFFAVEQSGLEEQWCPWCHLDAHYCPYVKTTLRVSTIKIGRVGTHMCG